MATVEIKKTLFSSSQNGKLLDKERNTYLGNDRFGVRIDAKKFLWIMPLYTEPFISRWYECYLSFGAKEKSKQKWNKKINENWLLIIDSIKKCIICFSQGESLATRPKTIRLALDHN